MIKKIISILFILALSQTVLAKDATSIEKQSSKISEQKTVVGSHTPPPENTPKSSNEKALVDPRTTNLQNSPSTFADIIEKVNPAVVNISTVQKVEKPKPMEMPDNLLEFFEFQERELERQKNRKITSLGSGFVVDPNGYIVTNYHVIAEAEQIEVNFSDELMGPLKAKVIGKDPKTDLALLKVESKKPLPYLTFGDSEKSRVGDWVLVIGNPFGLSGTASSGIISAKARYLNNSQYDDYIQTDASINKGNSGGPMFNTQGEVIGVNTIILSTSGGSMGIGFSVPSSIVKPVIEQLKTKGEIIRGWLGVKVQIIDEKIKKSMGLPDQKGALVAEIMKDSPADKAGIKVGDVIIKFDGKDVLNMNKLPRIVADTPINKKVDIEIIRNGKTMILKATTEKPKVDPFNEEEPNEEKQEAESKAKAKVVLGLRVDNINQSIISRFRLDSGIIGVVIVSIEKDSILADSGLMAGDVIQRVNQMPITSVDEFIEAIKRTQKRGEFHAALLVTRRGESRFLSIDLQ